MPTFDAVATGSGGAGSAFTLAHTVGAGANRLLLVGLDLEGATDEQATSVTWNSVALTRLVHLRDGNHSDRVGELWYLVGPAAGSFNVVGALSAVVDCKIRAVSYSGVNQSTPFGTVATAAPGGQDTAPTVTVVSATGELVVDHVACGVLVTVTAGGGQTERGKLLDSGGGCVFGSEKAGAASVAMSWTIDTARHWVAIGVPLKPPVGLLFRGS